MSDIPPRYASRGAAKGAGRTAGCNFDDLVVGVRAPSLGVTITEILHRSDTHVIFFDERRNLQWCYHEQPPDSGWIYARVVELEGKCGFFSETVLPMWVHIFCPWARSLPSLNRILESPTAVEAARSARFFIGQGVVAAFTGSSRTEVAAAFDNAEKFIEQRGRETSLGWLYSTFSILALLSAIALLTLIFTTDISRDRLVWSTLACALAGGIGAYLSRAFASRTDLPCDANAGWYLHVMEALLRWSVGVAAGALLFLLVKGKVFLGSLPLDDTGFPVVLALAALAGLSERFLPTLLSRFDEQLTGTAQERTPPPARPAGDAPAPVGSKQQTGQENEERQGGKSTETVEEASLSGSPSGPVEK